MNVKLLTEQHLEFLSFKGECTGSSESTLVKIPHCWKSHVVAHIQKTMKIHSTCALKIQVLRVRDLLKQICFGGSIIQSILCLKCVKDVLILDLGGLDQLDIELFGTCSTVFLSKFGTDDYVVPIPLEKCVIYSISKIHLGFL